MYFDQKEFDIRCEWGIEGVNLLADSSDAIIIVDVISFTTAVDVALSRGAIVYPFGWKDERAATFASSKDAILAAGNRRDPTGFSLAPSSLLRLEPGTRIVLPSPNGATLSLATGDTPTFAGCLRNASAVAAAAAQIGQHVSVIPAGERWADGSLRPAIEDLIGAGAVMHVLPGSRSPEAKAAVAVFLHFRAQLLNTLASCSSGKETADRGSRQDIELAAAYDSSTAAPRLLEGAYQ